MTIPAPPSGESFSPQQNPRALVCIKVLRVDHNHPDTFNRNEGRPVSATFMDVWVLADSPEVGRFISNAPNTSQLGKQLAGSVGETFYGRIGTKPLGKGTSYVLVEPYPQDQPLIAQHKAQLAAEYAQPRQTQPVQHNYQNEPMYQQPYQQAAPQQTYAPPQNQPYYQPSVEPGHAQPNQPSPQQPYTQPPAQGYGQPPNGAQQPAQPSPGAPQPAYAQPGQPPQAPQHVPPPVPDEAPQAYPHEPPF